MSVNLITVGRTMRVFVVDDESTIARTLATILCQKGFNASPYTNPLNALEAAQYLVPDLLISDVAMPELSGIELAIQMKAQHPGCKVLLFSGQATTANLLEEARNAGHDFVLLTKPVHPTDLLLQIGQMLETGEPCVLPAELTSSH